MISKTLTQNITNITELKKNPVELSKHNETCVLSNGKPCFYSVSPERMAELLDAEKLALELSEMRSTLIQSLESMHDGGLINWAIKDTIFSKLGV